MRAKTMVGAGGRTLLLVSAIATMAAFEVGAAPLPADAAPAEPGKAILNRSCQSCHDLGTITEAEHTAEEWPRVVARMRTNGAVLSDAEAKQLQAYLIKAYPKRP